MDGEHITADLAAIIEDAPPERQIEHDRLHRRPCDRSTVHFEMVPRPPVPREPGDELRVAAVRMAERGLRVFELRPGEKLPQFKGWQHGEVDGGFVPGRAATSNVGEVWRRWTGAGGTPAAFNVGVFTDDLLVLDFDAGKDEPIDEAIGRLCVDVDRRAADAGMHVLDTPEQVAAWKHGNACGPVQSPFRTMMDNTFAVRTGGGGRHFYFRMPEGQRAKGGAGKLLRLAPDQPSCIDVRAAGGLVVAPGSRTAKGEYTVAQHHAILEAPAALIALCGLAGQAPDRAERTSPEWGAATPPGRLEDATAYLLDERTPVSIEGQGGDTTAFAVACGLHDLGVYPGDAVALLVEHWNERCEPPFSEDELADKVRNASAYAENPFACRAADVVFAGIELPEPTPTRAARVQFLADQGELAPPQWLVKGLLPRVGVGLLAGQLRVGKSFLAHDLCGAVASGSPFFGHKVRERFATLYIAAEGAGTAPRRLEALRLHKLGGVDRTTLPIAYASLGTPCTPGNVASLRELVAEAATALQHRSGPRLGLVVVDTVAAAFSGLDENDNGQATQAMTALGSLGAEFGLFILAVHHYGKDAATGARGASGWTASADIILAATGNVNEATGVVSGRTLALTKARDGEQRPISDYALQQVHMGVDEDGDAITSAVVQPVSKGAQAFVRDTPKAVLLRECVEAALIEDGEMIEGRRWTEVEAVRAVFKDRWPGGRERSNINRNCREALSACIADGTVLPKEYLGRNYLALGRPGIPAMGF